MVVVSAGIKPRDDLARDTDIAIGERGGIVVDEQVCLKAQNILVTQIPKPHSDLLLSRCS